MAATSAIQEGYLHDTSVAKASNFPVFCHQIPSHLLRSAGEQLHFQQLGTALQSS